MTAIDDVYAMPHLAAILVSGVDAEKFLQSQLSSNVAALAPGAVQLSCWCAANGRVIGLGWLFRTDVGFCWIVAADTAEPIVVGLNKYRLRSKVSISRSDASTCVVGSESGLNELYSSVEVAPMIWVRLADGRSLGCASVANALIAPEYFLSRWYRRDIELKIAWNGGGERFLPQMLGVERFAGLSLKKGCFPGQEVISRLHYKGVLKRSLRVLQFDQPIGLGRFFCTEANDEIEIIQAQALIALAVVGKHVSRNFSIQIDGLAAFCRSGDDEFVETL